MTISLIANVHGLGRSFIRFYHQLTHMINGLYLLLVDLGCPCRTLPGGKPCDD